MPHSRQADYVEEYVVFTSGIVECRVPALNIAHLLVHVRSWHTEAERSLPTNPSFAPQSLLQWISLSISAMEGRTHTDFPIVG
jgi:hypothetical protein